MIDAKDLLVDTIAVLRIQHRPGNQPAHRMRHDDDLLAAAPVSLVHRDHFANAPGKLARRHAVALQPVVSHGIDRIPAVADPPDLILGQRLAGTAPILRIHVQHRYALRHPPGKRHIARRCQQVVHPGFHQLDGRAVRFEHDLAPAAPAGLLCRGGFMPAALRLPLLRCSGQGGAHQQADVGQAIRNIAVPLVGRCSRLARQVELSRVFSYFIAIDLGLVGIEVQLPAFRGIVAAGKAVDLLVWPPRPVVVALKIRLALPAHAEMGSHHAGDEDDRNDPFRRHRQADPALVGRRCQGNGGAGAAANLFAGFKVDAIIGHLRPPGSRS
ncbi:hypothetical protein D9M69_489970 [compost metagenome]